MLLHKVDAVGSPMRLGAIHAAFHARLEVLEIASTVRAEQVQRAVAERAVELFGLDTRMAREFIAFRICEERVSLIAHCPRLPVC